MRTLLRAARVLPDAETEHAPGAVVVEDDRVAWVGGADDAPSTATAIDLGEATLTPGLVNAHSHLDLSHLKGRVPFEGDFARWARGIVKGRGDGDIAGAAAEAVRAAARRGTTAFGDIVTPPHLSAIGAVVSEAGLRARLFVEALGFRPELAERAFAETWELVEMRAQPPGVATGLGPHAPYSVSAELLERFAAVADGHDRPLAIHFAETLEELAFVRHGIGPLRELLQEFGADDPEHRPYGTLTEVLRRLHVERAPLLLVHGNYLRPRDVPGGAFVVYCPTAHQFFGHPEHPVLELLEEGVRVALGSDSAASGETTDALSETQFLARARMDLTPRMIFRMATEWGAKALGFNAGRIQVGRLADLAAFTPAGGHEVLGDEAAACVLTMVGGKIVHRRES